jgi:hypothetical protein
VRQPAQQADRASTMARLPSAAFDSQIDSLTTVGWSGALGIDAVK